MPLKIEKSHISNGRCFDVDEGRVSFSGLETGKITIQKREGDKVVLRIAGFYYWAGIMQRNYASPRYLIGVFKGDRFFCYRVVEYAKDCMADAKKRANELFEEMEWNEENVCFKTE